MRPFLFLVSLFFCTVLSKAQSQENSFKNTNHPVNAPVVQDTVVEIRQLELEEIQSKKSKSSKPVKKAVFEDQADKDSNASMQQLKSAKYQFETNYSNSKHQLTRRSADPQELFNMKQSAELIASMLPGSFEKHFYTYLLCKYDPKQFSELEQAAKLEPTKIEVQQELVAFGVAVNNQNLADSVTRQMIHQNKISAGLLSYANDLVNSVPSNGTLLLHGYTELIPVNFEKNTLGRTDLELISIDLMQSPDYQASLESKGYIMPNSTFVDTTFVQTFCALNVSKNLYLSMSFPKEYFQGVSPSLNPVGLTFAYDQGSSFNYNAWNISLVESTWKTNELGRVTDQQSDALSANYLPTLLSVARLYEEYNKTEEVKEINRIILSVATRARKTGQLSKIKR